MIANDKMMSKLSKKSQRNPALMLHRLASVCNNSSLLNNAGVGKTITVLMHVNLRV